MKKNLKIFVISILLFILLFFVCNIREYIDAHTEFDLNENSFILYYIDTPIYGGLASHIDYYEIDLDKKIIDYRYDFTYFDVPANNWLKQTFGNKIRKLEQRYNINDSIVKELTVLFNELTQKTIKSKKVDTDKYDYYLLKSSYGDYNIIDKNQVDKIKQILNNIKK